MDKKTFKEIMAIASTDADMDDSAKILLRAGLSQDKKGFIAAKLDLERRLFFARKIPRVEYSPITPEAVVQFFTH